MNHGYSNNMDNKHRIMTTQDYDNRTQISVSCFCKSFLLLYIYTHKPGTATVKTSTAKARLQDDWATMTYNDEVYWVTGSFFLFLFLFYLMGNIMKQHMYI